MTATRRLAAIMAIDVVGYSRLMGEDEAGTALRVREHRDAARPFVVEKGGRIVKTMGDGLLLEFPSVVDAVACAVAIQKLMAERNVATPEGQRIVYRIGVNLGDILIDGDDILGDGVNVAARIEGLCEPGGVLVSASAYDQVRARLDVAFVDLGPKAMKNIAEPVRVYAIDIGALAKPKLGPLPATPKKRGLALALGFVAVAAMLLLAASVGAWRYLGARQTTADAAPALTPPTRLSLVVLPFSNLSGDASQDYLVDALVDELTTYVSRIPDTFVIARNSAFTYKGKAVDINQVGRELGVRYALEGSVQPTPNRIRVNAQLIDAETGAHLWAETFDEDRADLLQMEDDIVTRLARSLDIQLTAVEAAKGGRLRPDSPDVRDLALQCLAVSEANPPAITNPTSLLTLYVPCEQTLQRDPFNLIALVALTGRQTILLLLGGGTEFDAETKRLEDLAERALVVQPNSLAAHEIRANLYLIHGRSEEAMNEYERAIALNPADMGAYDGLCVLGMRVGQSVKSLECADKAIRLSPRDPFLPSFLMIKVFALSVLLRDEEALPLLHQALSFMPSNSQAWRMQVILFSNLGRDREAHEAYEHYAALPGKKFETVSAYRSFLLRSFPSTNPAWLGFLQRAYSALRKAGMPEQ